MSPKLYGFLIDIDGVLITGNQKIPGSLDTLNYLHKNNIPFLLITNTTRKSRRTIWHKLIRFGYSVSESQILTAPRAAVQWLREKNAETLYLLLSGSAVNEFKEFKIISTNPDYIVIGDLGNDLTFEKINTAFRLIMSGSNMLALQKNRFWQTAEGLTIDAGAVVAALEFATRKQARIIGKPSKYFFLTAAKKINIPVEKLAVVGDDLESDIKGGQNAGCTGIAVKTGKYREEFLKKTKIYPDFILNSIADLKKITRNFWEKPNGYHNNSKH